MEIAVRIFLGACLGALLGLAIGRSKVCHSGACKAKSNLIFSVLAGAVFGAAVAYYLISR